MLTLADMGATICPPAPAFYNRPRDDRRHRRPDRAAHPRPVRPRSAVAGPLERAHRDDEDWSEQLAAGPPRRRCGPVPRGARRARARPAGRAAVAALPARWARRAAARRGSRRPATSACGAGQPVERPRPRVRMAALGRRQAGVRPRRRKRNGCKQPNKNDSRNNSLHNFLKAGTESSGGVTDETKSPG